MKHIAKYLKAKAIIFDQSTIKKFRSDFLTLNEKLKKN